MNVALTATPDHIPANLLREIDPWQLLMSAGKDAMDKIEMRASGVFRLENLRFKWTTSGGA